MACTSRSRARHRPRTGPDLASRRCKPRDTGLAWHFLSRQQGAWPLPDTGHTAKRRSECNGLFAGCRPAPIGDQIQGIGNRLVKVDPGSDLGGAKRPRDPFNAHVLAGLRAVAQTLITVEPG